MFIRVCNYNKTIEGNKGQYVTSLHHQQIIMIKHGNWQENVRVYLSRRKSRMENVILIKDQTAVSFQRESKHLTLKKNYDLCNTFHTVEILVFTNGFSNVPVYIF